MNPKPESANAAFNASDNTSLGAIRKRVEAVFPDNPEGAFQEYEEHLADIVKRRKGVIKADIEGDSNVPFEVVNDFTKLDAEVDRRFREISATDAEIIGIIDDMRKIREAQAAVATAEARQKEAQAERADSELELAKLEAFRERLDYLGLDTTKEDAAILALRSTIGS